MRLNIYMYIYIYNTYVNYKQLINLRMTLEYNYILRNCSYSNLFIKIIRIVIILYQIINIIYNIKTVP